MIFTVYDQPRFAGMKMFFAFIVLLLSFVFFIDLPFLENVGSYLSLWFILALFFLIKEKMEIDAAKKEIIYTIYLATLKYKKRTSIQGFDAMVVKLFWEKSAMKYSRFSKKIIGGTSVFIMKIKTKEFIHIESYAQHGEAKSLIDFCTSYLNLEIRDEYQERIDASKLKRKFGVYR